jgi:hypothetical protein
MSSDFGGSRLEAFGPFCLNNDCRGMLENSDYERDYSCRKGICIVCQKEHSYNLTLGKLRESVIGKYEANERQKLRIISLDIPPTNVKVKDEDENFYLSSRIGELNGKRVGVVYFGERKTNQSSKDKVQLFIDLDDEQVRFDKNNMHPKEIIAKLTVEFKDSRTTIAPKPTES